MTVLISLGRVGCLGWDGTNFIYVPIMEWEHGPLDFYLARVEPIFFL